MTTQLWEKRFSELFPGLLTDLQESPLNFENGRNAQATENMVYVGGAANVRGRLPLSDVCAVIQSVAHRWECRSKGVGKRIFYVWYDEQAAQLRMSVILGDLKSGLPFKAPIKLVEHPEPVARQYLDGTDIVAWGELEPVGIDEFADSSGKASELLVFATEFRDEKRGYRYQ